MKPKKGDLIVVITVLVLAGAVYLFNASRQNSDENLKVEVRIDGQVVDSFNLDDNIDQVYETEFGYNRLVIEDGHASVIESDCRDQICVDTKDASANGDAIVCVPNRFTVEIIGGKGGVVDAIAQ